MQATRKIMTTIQTNIENGMNGSNTALSQPVIRYEDGQTYLAVFVFLPQKNEVENGAIHRPVLYVLSDLESGKVCKFYSCQKHDFCDEPYNKTYSMSLPENADVSDEFYDALYELMDSTRQTIIETGDAEYYEPIYRKYLERLFSSVPQDYIVFYKALSNLPPTEEKKAPVKAEEERPMQAEAQTEAKPEEEIPRSVFTVNDVKWTPKTNLSTLPEKTFRTFERLAESIEFLECDRADQIRYAYPLFCFEGDRTDKSDVWSELIVKANDPATRRGHFRTRPQNSIYTQCKNAQKGCLFGKCPYVVAAYIKYLKELDPERLKAERSKYMASRHQIDERYSEPFGAKLNIRAGIDKTLLTEGLKLSDSGTVNTQVEGDDLIITWVEDLGPKGMQIQSREFPIKDAEKYDGQSETLDKDGDLIPANIMAAVIADYIDRTGWNSYFKQQTPKQADLQPKQEDPQPKTQEVKQEAPKPKAQPSDLTKYINQNNRGYKLLADQYILPVYGTIITTGLTEDSPIIRAIVEAFENKGVHSVHMLEGKTVSAQQMPSGLCFIHVEQDTPKSPLRRFYPTTSIFLYGSSDAIRGCLADPVMKNIYTRCQLQDEKPNFSAVYDDLVACLPQNLKSRLTEESKNTFITWAQNKAFPENTDQIGKFMAWQCVIENRIIFEAPKREVKNNAET